MKSQKYSVYILAAGTGNRLGKLGKKTPKSLLKFGNNFLIDTILHNLKKNNLNKINIVVGYKKEQIIKYLKKYKDFKFNFIKIKNYNINGSSYSWYSIKKNFLKEKKPSIIMHSDIYFDQIILKKVLNSKCKNVICGIRNNNFSIDKKWLIKSDVNNQILSLSNTKYPRKTYFTEVACINKFSKKDLYKILDFMKHYFYKNHKKNTWEKILNEFIEKKILKIHTIKILKKYWFNINTKKEYFRALKFYKKL